MRCSWAFPCFCAPGFSMLKTAQKYTQKQHKLHRKYTVNFIRPDSDRNWCGKGFPPVDLWICGYKYPRWPWCWNAPGYTGHLWRPALHHALWSHKRGGAGGEWLKCHRFLGICWWTGSGPISSPRISIRRWPGTRSRILPWAADHRSISPRPAHSRPAENLSGGCFLSPGEEHWHLLLRMV